MPYDEMIFFFESLKYFINILLSPFLFLLTLFLSLFFVKIFQNKNFKKELDIFYLLLFVLLNMILYLQAIQQSLL